MSDEKTSPNKIDDAEGKDGIPEKIPEGVEEPEELEEYLEDAPPEVREQISQFMGLVRHGGGSPITAKVNEEHITKVLDNSDKRDERDRKERGQIRWFSLALVGIALAFVTFLVIFLKDEKDILIPILTSVLAFIGGFAGGWWVRIQIAKGQGRVALLNLINPVPVVPIMAASVTSSPILSACISPFFTCPASKKAP